MIEEWRGGHDRGESPEGDLKMHIIALNYECGTHNTYNCVVLKLQYTN